MKQVLVLGLDTFARKNRAQLQLLGAHGYRFQIFTNDLRGESIDRFRGLELAGHEICVLQSARARLWRLVHSLRTNDYHHAELYATGRLALLYVMLLKLFRIPFIVIERGDVGVIDTYGFLTRLSMRAAYAVAEVVIFKETYMRESLERFRPKSMAFIPNSVTVPAERTRDRSRRFLWANRIIPQRRVMWLVDAFAHPALTGARATVVGFEQGARLAPGVLALQEEIRRRAPANVELLSFTDPQPFYETSTYFCFPSEKVFGNNALLEAMARGLVPVVTEAPGVELIVQDGVNGVVTAFTAEAYRAGLERALALGDDEISRLSAAAVSTVRERFSPSAWTDAMCGVYASLH